MTSTPTESSMTPSYESNSTIGHPNAFIVSDTSVTQSISDATTNMDIDVESLTDSFYTAASFHSVTGVLYTWITI